MNYRLIKENFDRHMLEVTNSGFVTLYRGIRGDLLISPETSFDLDRWQKLFNRALTTGDRVAGERLLSLRRASAGQYFSDSLEVAKKYAGKNGTVYAVRVPESLAGKAAMRAAASTQSMASGFSALFNPSELMQLAKKNQFKAVSGPGKIIPVANSAGVRTVLKGLAARTVKGLAKGGIPALIGDIAGTVAAPYIMSLLTGKDIKDINNLTDIGWAYVSAAFPGGKTPQQAAYETWAKQLKAKGQPVPDYKQFLQAKQRS